MSKKNTDPENDLLTDPKGDLPEAAPSSNAGATNPEGTPHKLKAHSGASDPATGHSA